MATGIKGYKTAVLALHAFAAVCTIIALATAGRSLDVYNKAVKVADEQTNQALETASAWQQWAAGQTAAMMNQAAQQAATNSAGSNGRRLLAVSYYTAALAPVNFLIFTSVTGLLVNVFLAMNHLSPKVHQRSLGALTAKSPSWAMAPFYEMIITSIWFIFWLAAAGSVTSSAAPGIYWAGVGTWASENAIGSAMLAFSWLSWLAWTAMTGLVAAQYGINMRAAAKKPESTDLPKVAPTAPAAKDAATPAVTA